MVSRSKPRSSSRSPPWSRQAAAVREEVGQGDGLRRPRLLQREPRGDVRQPARPGHLAGADDRGDDGRGEGLRHRGQLKHGLRGDRRVLAQLAHAEPARELDRVVEHDRHGHPRHPRALEDIGRQGGDPFHRLRDPLGGDHARRGARRGRRLPGDRGRRLAQQVGGAGRDQAGAGCGERPPPADPAHRPIAGLIRGLLHHGAGLSFPDNARNNRRLTPVARAQTVPRRPVTPRRSCPTARGSRGGHPSTRRARIGQDVLDPPRSGWLPPTATTIQGRRREA